MASKKIVTDFYMDEFVSEVNSEEETLLIYEEVRSVMDSARLPLRKWHSNSGCFMNGVPDAEKLRPLRLNDA